MVCAYRRWAGMEDKVNLWLLALVPVYLFVWTATLGRAMTWLADRTLDGGNWWAFPSYMAFAFTAVAIGLGGVVLLIMNSFGAF